jgi:SH3-like domain-containing protein
MWSSQRFIVRLVLTLAVLGLVATAEAAQTRLLCVHDVRAPDQLAVRSAPDVQAPVVARYPADACGVELVGQCTNGWCEMSLKGVRGWVYTKNIAVYDVSAEQAAAAVQAGRPPVVEQGSREPPLCVARVQRGDTLRLRTGPGVGHDEIAGIPPGACDVERAGGCRGRWCKVTWQGRVGWANAYYLD